MKLIDKDAVVAMIERKITVLVEDIKNGDSSTKTINESKVVLLQSLLAYIDSCEVYNMELI